MLRYLTGAELAGRPRLRSSMFTHRAAQFRARLCWDVAVSAEGHEHDQYDVTDARYVIWERPDGTHGGSMRFLPTTGPTMIDDHFRSLTDGVAIRSPWIWECTRFCVAPDAASRIAPIVLLGGLDLGLRHGLSHAVGVFCAPMLRVYRRLGWAPAVLGIQGQGRDAISVGIWTFEAALRPNLLARAGVSAELADHWLQRTLLDRVLAKAG